MIRRTVARALLACGFPRAALRLLEAGLPGALWDARRSRLIDRAVQDLEARKGKEGRT